MADPLRVVGERSLRTFRWSGSGHLIVRVVDHLECGHLLEFETGSYRPTERRRCRECGKAG